MDHPTEHVTVDHSGAVEMYTRVVQKQQKNNKNSDVSTSLILFHYDSITRIKKFKLIGGDLEVAPYDDF